MRFLLYVCLAGFLSCAQQSTSEKAPALPETSPSLAVSKQFPQQLLVVVTADWEAVQGELRRYEGSPGAWEPVGAPIPIVVGQKGLGWARRAPERADFEGPVKVEGDKKSPAGQFELGPAFGYAAKPGTVDWPYVLVDEATMCIEDADSKVYNQIIDARTTAPDYSSTDRMRRTDDLYEWGVWVYHNFPDPEPAAGSCIFLHVWRKNDAGTAGCTAMDKGQMRALIEWLDPAKKPLLIQMPQLAYAHIQGTEKLPFW